MSEKPGFQFFVSSARLGLYGLLALGVFFSAAFLVFFLRSGEQEEFPMPDLIGKYYIDVHNDLVRMQIRAVIQKKSYPDKTPGIILGQSVQAGTSITPREKIYITVNQPEPILVMPELVGASLESAKSKIAHIPADEDVFAVQIGSISYVPAANVPEGTVLSQLPLAKEKISPADRVYLLVSSAQDSQTKQAVENPSGQNIGIAAQMFAKQNVNYRIKEIESPAAFADSGLIKSVEKSGDTLMVNVYYKKPSVRFRNALEKIEVELDEPGACKGEATQAGKTDVFFVTGPRTQADSKKTPLFFYRTGEASVRITCGDSTVFKKTFRPDSDV